ncbi:MAG: hypothetical protein U0795_06895 [Pirellulales bacterium]
MEYMEFKVRLPKVSWPFKRIPLRAFFGAILFVACLLAAYRIGQESIRQQYRPTNSFYLVWEDAAGTSTVSALPIIGNETVWNVITMLGGAPQLKHKQIQISRAAPKKKGGIDTLDVNVNAILSDGDLTTNYALAPGDRVFILPASRTGSVKYQKIAE